jgi:phosphatidylinositol alpha-1,6-mannosyltransferase
LNWEVSVVTPQDHAEEQEIREFNSAQSFPIVRLRSKGAQATKAILRRQTARWWIKQWNPDVLVASGQRSAWIATTLSNKLPLIIVGHGFEFGILGHWNNKLTRWAFEQASLVVCVSEYTRRKMLAAGIQPPAVHVITNGADQIRFAVLPPDQVLAARKSLGLENARLLITVGNVTERKGQEVVIRALPEILARVPNTHYLIVGLPTRKSELSNIAEELGVADHVHFLGRVENGQLVSLLNCADVFVMTSRFTREGDSEGFGIAAVEAALCGKPAVVSGNSGLAEAVIDGETGIVVPQNHEEETAKAIVNLLTNAERRAAMGRAARTRALAWQTWEQAAKHYDTAIRSVVPSNGNGSKARRAFSIK